MGAKIDKKVVLRVKVRMSILHSIYSTLATLDGPGAFLFRSFFRPDFRRASRPLKNRPWRPLWDALERKGLQNGCPKGLLFLHFWPLFGPREGTWSLSVLPGCPSGARGRLRDHFFGIFVDFCSLFRYFFDLLVHFLSVPVNPQEPPKLNIIWGRQ